MSRGLAALVIWLALVASGTAQPPISSGQSSLSGTGLVMALRGNVVALEARWPNGPVKDGFGFVVALDGGTAYVATAGHVLQGGPATGGATPRVTARLLGRPGRTFAAEQLALSAASIDLGVLTMDWPVDLAWTAEALAPEEAMPNFGDPVWFIGRDREWYVPASPGAFNRASQIDRRVRIDNLPVRPGTSGAPLLSSAGIIGMIIRDASAAEAVAVPISAIRLAFEEWGLPWQLRASSGVPPSAVEPPSTVVVPPTALAETAAAAEAAFGLDRQDRVLIQRALRDLGFDLGPADGVLGARSRAAIRDYQAGAGAVSTGYLTREQAGALLDHAAALQARERRVAEQPVTPAPSVRRPGDTFNDCDDEGWCPEMVVVPAGSFMMGSPEDEVGRRDAEGPRHRRTIDEPFAIGVYEVTFAEWDACVAAGGCNGHRPHDDGWGRGRRPVINVSWNDAKAYVNWLSDRTGEEYRLPSEAEWEYAARAGMTTPFHFGPTISTDQANYDGKYTYGSGRTGVYRAQTVPVGSFPANEFGLHDVHGNAWEWMEDCWNDSYAGAPGNSTAWTTGNCSRRVVRGGSWNFPPRLLRAANRYLFGPAYRKYFIGFRVARTLR